MAFQPVPPQSDLQASIPAGRLAVALRPYAKPVPAFGPGSVEYTRLRAEELELLQKDGDGTDKEAAGSALSPANGSYAADRPYF